MRISAKLDYALRAMAELALLPPGRPGKAEAIAEAQEIPVTFLLGILGELRQEHLVRSLRGRDGGYLLALPAEQISLADVARAVEGPLANVRDVGISELSYDGAARALPEIWMAVRTSLRDVFERVSVAELASGRLPESVRAMARRYQAEERRRHPAVRRSARS